MIKSVSTQYERSLCDLPVLLHKSGDVECLTGNSIAIGNVHLKHCKQTFLRFGRTTNGPKILAHVTKQTSKTFRIAINSKTGCKFQGLQPVSDNASGCHEAAACLFSTSVYSEKSSTFLRLASMRSYSSFEPTMSFSH